MLTEKPRIMFIQISGPLMSRNDRLGGRWRSILNMVDKETIPEKVGFE
jgi:hypothetical protein